MPHQHNNLNVPSVRTARIMNALHRRLGHHPSYYVTGYTSQDAKPCIIVYVTKRDPQLTADIPESVYGIPTAVQTTSRKRSVNAVQRHMETHDATSQNSLNELEQSILDGYACWTDLRQNTSGKFTLTIPYWDCMGDPIHFAITITDTNYRVSDGGTIAAHLFSLANTRKILMNTSSSARWPPSTASP